MIAQLQKDYFTNAHAMHKTFEGQKLNKLSDLKLVCPPDTQISISHANVGTLVSSHFSTLQLYMIFLLGSTKSRLASINKFFHKLSASKLSMGITKIDMFVCITTINYDARK
jgi:hypothetical protein